MNTLNPLAEYNNINLVGADTEDQDLFNTMLENSDEDVLETLTFLNGYGLNISFKELGDTINGQAEVGGNEIVLDDALLKDPAKLKDVFAHELAHILGASHETNDEEDEKFEELVKKLTNGEYDDLNSVFELYNPSKAKGVENSADGHGDHGKKDDNEKKDDKVDKGKGVENDTESTDDSGDHGDYTEELFGALDTIADTIGFDVLAKLNDLYDGLKGTKIGGKDNREFRNKYNEGIIQIMTDFFKALDAEVAKYNSYEEIKDDGLKQALDATAKWIQIGLHSGTDNDNSTGAHANEAATGGKAGAAFVIAHGMQAGDDTKMHDLFRAGDSGALGELDGAKLFGYMKENGGLTGLYTGDNGISTFLGASADTTMKGGGVAVQNPAAARDYFESAQYDNDYPKGADE